jgi:hypothetical protein
LKPQTHGTIVRSMSSVNDDATAKLMSSNSDDWLGNFFAMFDTTIAGDVEEFDVNEVLSGGLNDAISGGEREPAECENSVFADEADENGKRGRAPTTSSAVLSEGAKKNKSKREKLRRDALNDKFNELSAALEPGAVPKTDKAKIVVAATALIKKLRDQHGRLTDMIVKMREDEMRQREANEKLVQEKMELLHEKLRIEAQLQTYLTSMPFSSGPLVTGADGKTTMAPAGFWPSMAFPTPFLEPNAEEPVEDVTLRAPVA